MLRELYFFQLRQWFVPDQLTVSKTTLPKDLGLPLHFCILTDVAVRNKQWKLHLWNIVGGAAPDSGHPYNYSNRPHEANMRGMLLPSPLVKCRSVGALSRRVSQVRCRHRWKRPCWLSEVRQTRSIPGKAIAAHHFSEVTKHNTQIWPFTFN